ncbi:MAG: SusC/RagA family TonB-linked outer membrane protein, partial [Muribaculaceae bacterium]|nr:SusC/RagA family TonB-linked outer membrane protein [Muribaculaceae bacterium]
SPAQLAARAGALLEVVSVGYGTVKKSDATGSVAVVRPDEIEAGIATSTQDLLVGASPGVVVTLDGGSPTGNATIRIRGGSSLSASNDPLIVIDGVAQTNQNQGGGMNALTMINPSNIESMTILKDASATAIYGSRASNGVIIITTKKGQRGRPQVNFSANLTVNHARKTLDMMNGLEFADYVREHLGETSIAQLGYGADAVNYNTDWQKEVLRTSFSQDYNLSVGGSAGILPYRVNVSYTNNQGILKTSSMERTTVGFNLTPKFFDNHLSVIAQASGTYGKTGNADQGAIGAAIAFDPTKPVYSNVALGNGMMLYNGYYNFCPGGLNDRNSAINPVQLLNDVASQNQTWSSNGNLQLDYALHFLPELHLNLNLGYQVSKNEAKSITAANSLQAWRNTDLLGNEFLSGGAATRYDWHEIQRNTSLEFYANYKKEFEAIMSNLDVTAGYSWQRFSYFGHSFTTVNSLGWEGLTYNDGVYSMPASSHDAIGKQIGTTGRWAAPVQLLSFFGRVNYSFDDTYLLTVTLRDDASSRFSKDTRWGLFPAVAFGWKINNLPALRDSRTLTEWKLRLGWGETGQQDIGSYFPYMPVYTISSNNFFQYPGYNGGWISPMYPQPYDANIKWETTTTWNVGMDLSFLNNRITASIDWYQRDTRDLLAYTPAVGLQTSDYLTTNIGTLRNTGFEITLGAKPVVTRDFTWSTGFNLSYNRNKITKLNDGKPMSARGIPGGGIGGDLQWFMQGEAAYTYRVYQQVYNEAGDPIPGQYVDQNADGTIDQEDLINFHSPDPKFTLNWNNTFNFKNWDFGFTLRANIGNWVYNAPRRVRTNLGTVDAYGLNNLMRNEFIFPSNDNNLALSDYWVENASFLRCDNISLGYTWNNLMNDNLRVRLFGACQNPFVITKYKGLDPEVYSGCDDNVYPRPVTFTLGLVVTF